MNIIQYFKLENLIGYVERWGVEKVLIHPDLEDEIRTSKLADIIEEKNIICISPETELEERKASAGKTKTAYGKKQAEELTSAHIIVEKLKEAQKEGELDYHKVARIGRKMTDFAKLDEYTPRIHKLQYTPTLS